ncbi:MAG: hypothetical protein LBJ58_07025 [Tannerellaceae bacterium]|jgi:Tol biopolymer transport system component|nr:hypothetical protein [Tannerellaceae bacterium]
MMKRYTLLTIVALSVFSILLPTGCGEQTGASLTSDERPRIFPDYDGVTVPPNIAPLNFRIEGDVKTASVDIAGDDGQTLRLRAGKHVSIKPGDWRKLLKGNAGRSLSVRVVTRQADGLTIAWKPFHINISSDPIDSRLVYRLIEPGYEKWHIVGIYQRNLETFEERVIIKNDMMDYNCVNCHSFCNGDPQQMMFHTRAAYGGTYIVSAGNIEKLNTLTERTVSNMTYPYWHPSGRYIAASVNDVKQFFHAVKERKMEVFDLESDVVVYDVEKQAILSAASILTKEAYETFPSFSPDGAWLYYCSAPALPMPVSYEQIRYAICRTPFDESQGRTGALVDTVVPNGEHSASFPRISPDGRFLMYTETAYGQFPIWHKDAEIRMIDLERGEEIDMSPLNSEDTDSYHSWGRNSRWVAVSSRRENGLYTLPYFAHIDESGRPSKPFLLPQKSPDYYDYLLYSFNIPELVDGEVTVSPYALQHAAVKTTAKQIGFE